MRYPVLYNPYVRKADLFSSLKTRNRLVQIKSFAAFYYTTFCQYIPSKHVQTFWVARKPTLYWIKWSSISHKGISEGSLGIMLCTIQKKGFRPNRPIISFVAKSKRCPVVDCRGLSVDAWGYTCYGIHPTATALLENLILEKLPWWEKTDRGSKTDLAQVRSI